MKDLKIFTKDIEEKAKQEIDLLLEQEAFKDCKVRIMPDVHAGMGCVIGFTADLGDKVIPNVVGVDIGCGMTWCKLQEKNIDLQELDKVIRENIPSGMNAREYPLYTDIDLKELYCYNKLRNVYYLECSLGTLGGGNHFIEVDKDENGDLYLIVHSGSRNLGKQVCDIYQALAIEKCSFKEEMRAEKERAISLLTEQNRKQEISTALKEIAKKYVGKTKLPKDLCYLDGEDREHYLKDMRLCQKWAKQSREYIIDIILEKLCMHLQFDKIHTIHNYISDDNIVRKGAISCQKDEIALIPMNMKDGCLIVKGKGNEDWNCSAPHGAGRIMSRIQAKKVLSMVDYENQMKGIYTTSVCEETIDEAPMVYKSMQSIIENIGDTAEILSIIKPIYNFKAKE
jgi:RNA-splicing ligase RtcB